MLEADGRRVLRGRRRTTRKGDGRRERRQAESCRSERAHTTPCLRRMRRSHVRTGRARPPVQRAGLRSPGALSGVWLGGAGLCGFRFFGDRGGRRSEPHGGDPCALARLETRALRLFVARADGLYCDLDRKAVRRLKGLNRCVVAISWLVATSR